MGLSRFFTSHSKMKLYPSFLLLLLACSLQVTFCKSVWVLKDNEWIQVNRAHPSAVRDKRSVDQEQEYLEVEDNDMYEDYSTATPDQHRNENIGQEQDTMTMESGLNRRSSSLCSMCGSRSRCLRVFGLSC